MGSIQAAVDLLDDPALDAPARERLLAVVREEIGALAARIHEAVCASRVRLSEVDPAL
ncbi:MAG: hypothetical protein ACK51E_07125 [Gemmatimonadota bacterium]